MLIITDNSALGRAVRKEVAERQTEQERHIEELLRLEAQKPLATKEVEDAFAKLN